MTRLSVNINKIATLRNARGGDMPNVLSVAKDCEMFGAEGITVHPRPDERHIRYQDVYDLKPIISTEFNIEGYPSDPFLEMVYKIKPAQVTLVPDPPDAITSNAGWDIKSNFNFLKDVIASLKQWGIRTSVFVGTDLDNIEKAKDINSDRIELYTEPYVQNFNKNPRQAVKPFVLAAQMAKKVGIDVNAGHDLNLKNLKYLLQNIPFMKEVSIGHALICDALYYGLENTIQMYLREIKRAQKI